MDLRVQESLLRRLQELHVAGTTAMASSVREQPVAAYTDPDRLSRERQILFRSHPLVVGLSADLREIGEYRVVDVVGVSVLLVRGEDTIVRAFLNSCRHRGSPVAEGNGVAARVFKCPYHAWCYDIHGRLLGQPVAQEAFAEIPTDRLGLVALPVAEAGGLIMLAPDADAPAFDGADHLAGLADELDAHRFADFRLLDEQDHTVRCNWKQPYETFLEAYHVFALHRTTLSKQILSTPMLADFYGPHGRGVITGRDTMKSLQRLDPADWSLRECGANLVYWLFPNAVLSLPMTGHAELWLFYPDPSDPGSTRVHLRFYVPEDADRASREPFWQRMLEYSSTIVLREDFGQQAAIYARLASGSHPGLVFGRNEPALIHYHQALDDVLATSPAAREVHRPAVGTPRSGSD